MMTWPAVCLLPLPNPIYSTIFYNFIVYIYVRCELMCACSCESLIFGQNFFLAWSFVISNSKLGVLPAHVRSSFRLPFPLFLVFFTSSYFFWPSFFAHNLHANLPLSAERPLVLPPLLFSILAARAFSFFPHDCRSCWCFSFSLATHPPICLLAFFYPRSLLVHFLCPVNNFCSVYFSRVERRRRRQQRRL